MTGCRSLHTPLSPTQRYIHTHTTLTYTEVHVHVHTHTTLTYTHTHTTLTYTEVYTYTTLTYTHTHTTLTYTEVYIYTHHSHLRGKQLSINISSCHAKPLCMYIHYVSLTVICHFHSPVISATIRPTHTPQGPATVVSIYSYLPL